MVSASVRYVAEFWNLNTLEFIEFILYILKKIFSSFFLWHTINLWHQHLPSWPCCLGHTLLIIL